MNTSGAIDSDGKSVDLNYAITADQIAKVLRSEGIAFTSKGYSSWMGYVFLPLAALCLAGSVAMFLLSRKDAAKAPAQANNAGKAAPAAAAKGTPLLKGITGKYAGQEFDLSKNKVVLGRDPAVCNLIFESDTPGISGNHCQLTFDPATDGFVLTDNGSSFGTFLGNGKKLAAGVPEKLVSGDTFYLANTGNRFLVTKS